MAKSVKTVIKTVSFRSNIEIGKFQHAHVEATADVQAGQTVEEVLSDLQMFVADQLRSVKYEMRMVTQTRQTFAELLNETDIRKAWGVQD